jgi:retron-type reverse transcriptase
VSKILERLVLARIVPHVTTSTNFDLMQSAYRKHHSTETALLKITNDIYDGFDNRQSTILVALDQSAAFDCIDHLTLIRRLHHSFGIEGPALDWMTSYLQTRKSFVRFKNASSVVSAVEHGVPQGLSLGPLLFSLYIAPLSTVFRSFGLTHHQYADDSQIYVSAMKNELTSKVDLLEQCIPPVCILGCYTMASSSTLRSPT